MTHNFVPPGQPSEWPIPMDAKARAEFEPTAVTPDAIYTTVSQNRGGKA